MNEKNGKEYITEIRITSDEFSTADGISVGNDFDDIRSAYKKIERQSDASISYSGLNCIIEKID